MTDIKATLGVGLSGHFRVVKTKRTGEKTLDLSFNNLVLDVGWDNLSSEKIANTSNPGGSFAYWNPKHLFLGTGTTEPSPTDTGLQSVSATLPGKEGSFANSYDNLNKTADVDCTFSYGEGEAEGVWTELGLSFDSAYSKPYNRSLFRDGAGNPISITVLSDEYLTIYVNIRAYFNDITSAGTFTYNGSAVGYSVKWARDGISAWWKRGFSGPGVLHKYFKSYGNYENMPANFTYYSGASQNAANIGPGMYFEVASYTGGPETGSLTLEGFTFSYLNSNGATAEFLAIIFDAPINIPADHKITFGLSSFTISRGTVPAA